MNFICKSICWLAVVWISGCAGNRQQEASELSMDGNTQVYQRCISDACAKVILTYPMVEHEPHCHIIQPVEMQMIRAVQFGEEKATALEEAVEVFLDGYEDFRNSSPSTAQDWVIEVTAETVFVSDKLLTIKIRHYSFTGGAHPNSAIDYLTFDLRESGGLMDPSRLLTDRRKMVEMAEQKFMEFHGTPTGMTLKDDDRFFFGEDGFFLPKAMGYENNEWVMIYNPYEIAPYHMGYTELRFSLEEVEGVVISPF